MSLLFTLGLLSIAAQVVILRELVAALFGVELLYVIGLAAWLVGTGAGAFAGRWFPARRWPLATGFVVLAALLGGTIVLVRFVALALGAVPGAYLAFSVQLFIIAAATIPVAAVSGALFQVGARVVAQLGTPLGRAYAIESAGGGAGGVAVTLLLASGMSTMALAVATSALSCLAATCMLRRRGVAVLVGCLVLAATVVAFGQVERWDDATLRWQYPTLVAADDTPYARVVVTQSGAQFAVFENGALAAETEVTSAEVFADLAAIQVSGGRALVLGGGIEGVPAAVAAYGDRFTAVDNVEIDERAHALVRQIVPAPVVRGGRQAPISTVFGEPRTFLGRAGLYRLIVIAMPEPASGAASRFYTQEFFRLCRDHLAPGGVLAMRLPAAENFWPPSLVRWTASIHAALRHEFAAVTLLPGATLHVFASEEPLSNDPGALALRLGGRGWTPRVVTPPFLRYLYTNDRRTDVTSLLLQAHVAPSRDAAPACYQHAVMLWLSKFYPGLAVAPDVGGSAGVTVALALLIAAVGIAVWLRRGARRRLVGFVFVAGAAGMVLQTVLLLRYQITTGVIFERVGWLLTCVMAGLALGAHAAAPRPGVELGRATRPAARRRSGTILAVGFILLAVLCAGATLGGHAAGLAGTTVLLLATGIVIGAAFSHAGAGWPTAAGQGGAALYAGDLAGGALGAFVATLWLVPAFGFAWSALLTAGLGAALLVLGRV